MDDSGTVAVGPETARQLPPPFQRCSSVVEHLVHTQTVTGSNPVTATSRHHAMTWTPSATRADVIRLVGRFVQLEFSIRSAAGKLVIDETRVVAKDARRQAKDAFADAMALFLDGREAEAHDALRNANIRQAIYAKPEDPSPYCGGLFGRHRMTRVAPLKDVARVIRPRPTRCAAPDGANAREWRATVAQKLGHLQFDQQAAVVGAEKIRIGLKITRNRLEEARRAVGRLRSGGKVTRPLRQRAEEVLLFLRAREAEDGDSLKRLVRTGPYRHGIDNLLVVCTTSEDVERYLFGSRN